MTLKDFHCILKNNLFKEKCHLAGFTSAHLNLSHEWFFFLAQENEKFLKNFKMVFSHIF